MTDTTLLDQEFELVDVDELNTHPQNPNQGDIGAIAESMSVNGFYGALVVQRSTRFVLAGNHRLLAAQQLGLEQVPVVWADVDDVRALKILTVDNRSTRLGMDDQTALLEVLTSLAMDSEGLSGTGFDGDDLDAMLADQNADPAAKKSTKIFNISVKCADAVEQQDTLTRLLSHGFNAVIR